MQQRKTWSFDLHTIKSDLTSTSDPPGYNKAVQSDNSNSSRTSEKDAAKTIQLKQKRAMEIAYAPGKNLFMTAFMMYMSGSGVHIFSIMITGMALMNPLKAIASVNNAFASVNDGQTNLLQAKCVFVALNFVGLVMALYKCATMGLLPNTSADWSWLLPLRMPLEASNAAIPLP